MDTYRMCCILRVKQQQEQKKMTTLNSHGLINIVRSGVFARVIKRWIRSSSMRLSEKKKMDSQSTHYYFTKQSFKYPLMMPAKHALFTPTKSIRPSIHPSTWYCKKGWESVCISVYVCMNGKERERERKEGTERERRPEGNSLLNSFETIKTGGGCACVL